MFLGVHITEDLTWTTNTMSLSKKAQQRLHFLRRLKRASLPPPILTTFYRAPLRVCWPAASLSGTGTAVLLTARPSSGQQHSCKDHRCPSPIHPGHFPSTMLQQNQQHREGPHPPLPQSLPAPTIRKTVPEHQSPLHQTAQQLFSTRLWEPWTLITPPPLKPHANLLLKPPETCPPPLQTPPKLTRQRKTETFCAIQSVLHTGEWACTNHL